MRVVLRFGIPEWEAVSESKELLLIYIPNVRRLKGARVSHAGIVLRNRMVIALRVDRGIRGSRVLTMGAIRPTSTFLNLIQLN